MNQQQIYALIFLTVIIAVLVGVVTFALLRFSAAARDARKNLRESGDRTLVTAALQQAVEKLKAQERAMSARAVASEQLSSQIVSSLTAGLMVVDTTGDVQILNPAGRRLLGLEDGETPRDYRALLAHVPPLRDAIEESLNTGRPIVRRALQMPSASRATHFGVTVSPLTGEEGPHGAICLFSDLTSVMDLEEQLRLKDTLARLGELTAGIAHEFRNGLATIHGYARLIDPADVPPQHRPCVEGIRQETEALGAVVTNFLNFARPEHVVFNPVDLRAIAQRAADDLGHDVASRAEIRVEGEFGTIEGDEVMLRQAFSNLLRNAIEACEGAGRRPVVVVEGSVDPAQGTARVTVSDNGPGIKASAADRLFRPFFTTKSQGTGLGLAIVQKVVVTHNGRVTAGASAGGGAAFQVMFPLLPADRTEVT